MREIWKVTIYSIKDGKKDITKIDCDSRVDVSRVVMSFKAKIGYEIIKFRIEREWWLL